uniref:Uncharacterized protein n=1 Tax=Caenorhabditis japonica TaxID=281687 RepID=A0A8R1IER8_CAEJA
MMNSSCTTTTSFTFDSTIYESEKSTLPDGSASSSQLTEYSSFKSPTLVLHDGQRKSSRARRPPRRLTLDPSQKSYF